MKKILTLVVALIMIFGFSLVVDAATYVRGYTRSNGTYVQPYYRSTSNYTKADNYSSYGNYNPYTGKKGTIKYWNY